MSDIIPLEIPEGLCSYLRTKRFYVSGPRSKSTGMSDGHHHWCNKTMGVIGPDDDLVNIKRCNSGRTCYKAESHNVKMA